MINNESNDYDSEPVYYCAKCYSLGIKYEDAIDADCCMECGCSDILVTTIDEWERLYKQRYGHKYVEIKKNPRNNIIYNMSPTELKDLLYAYSGCDMVIRTLYPKFPRGLSKLDSILVLFDMLMKDGRMEDLKLLLIDIKNRQHGR